LKKGISLFVALAFLLCGVSFVNAKTATQIKNERKGAEAKAKSKQKSEARRNKK